MVQRYQQHSEVYWTPTPMTVLREIDEMQGQHGLIWDWRRAFNQSSSFQWILFVNKFINQGLLRSYNVTGPPYR